MKLEASPSPGSGEGQKPLRRASLDGELYGAQLVHEPISIQEDTDKSNKVANLAKVHVRNSGQQLQRIHTVELMTLPVRRTTLNMIMDNGSDSGTDGLALDLGESLYAHAWFRLWMLTSMAGLFWVLTMLSVNGVMV